MRFEKNEGSLDRAIRFILGVMTILWAYFYMEGILMLVILAIGIILLITALTGFCGIYKLVGINTATKEKNSNPNKKVRRKKK